MTAATTAARVASRTRNPNVVPGRARIDMTMCSNCDARLRSCPPQFGAIFDHGPDVVILPELCSGCGRCPPACPVDRIVHDPTPAASPDEWWALPLSEADPHV